MMTEPKWTFVNGYRVSEDGRDFSVAHNWRGYGEREMRQHANKCGYMVVRLTVDGNRKNYRVHRLVCEAFHGRKPSASHEVRHIDGSRDNNHKDNLAWGTRSENALDRQKHGTQFNPPWDDKEFRKSQSEAMRRAHARKRKGVGGRYA